MSSQTTAPAVPAEHRILRRAEVEAKTGFKRAHIYSLMKEGKFPKALRLGVRAVGWDSVEIEQWIADGRQFPIQHGSNARHIARCPHHIADPAIIVNQRGPAFGRTMRLQPGEQRGKCRVQHSLPVTHDA